MKAPSVIIGVGGVGSQICSKVENQLRRAKKSNDRSILKRESTRFVVLDTDVNSLRELYRNGFQGNRILLTDNMTVAKCRDIINDSSINDWYPDNTIFSKKSMTEGAGQQRSISRLAFEYCIRDGRLNQLDNVIRELNEMSTNDSSQQMRFYIISSLAGGTGSGVILPLAMYLNSFIKDEQGDDLGICKGFFVLSSAFYASCGSELEKKSLDANAYAAIKELSAFMRSSDDMTSPYLSYPLSNYGNYFGSTYEYCYLFGMTNAKSKNIHSFEDLKNMISDAVYMQACSPMHDRNSSREDNTVRHTTMLGQENQENWRRRFGGIGCGRLIYPYDELSQYFGLCWARDTMDKEWRKYDEDYIKAKKALKSKKNGKNKTVWLDQGNYYITSIERADYGDRQASLIKRECRKQNDKYPWENYLDSLKKELEKRLEEFKFHNYEQDDSEWHAFKVNLEVLKTKGNSSDIKKERYRSLKKIVKNMPNLITELEKQKDMLYADDTLFQLHIENLSEDEEIEELPKYYLEYWLFTEDKEFFHPNSVRYFLYKLEKLIVSNKTKEYHNKENKFKEFQIPEKESLDYKKSINFYHYYNDYVNNLYEEYKNTVIDYFIEHCKDYVKNLIKCYEEFYGNYDMILDEFNADIQNIEKELDKVSGVSYSYTCADSVCRDGLHEELSKRRSYDEGAVSGISYELYHLIHEEELKFAKMSTRECADKIKQFWYKNINKEEIGKEILNMNILEAMNKEEIFHNNRKLTEQCFEERIHRVQDVLVAPFLQYFQRIDMNLGISLCCYHSNLKYMVGEFRNMIEWLNEHNAVDDDTYCSERELLFYRSFVGLEAYEVLDFLHGVSAKTAVNGRAFRSYQNVLRNMGKNTGNASKVITPHADTRWHSLYEMPDPSMIYQEEQENLIIVALLYACLSGKLVYNDKDKQYDFIMSDNIKNFNNLYDFHLYLYGNSYCYMKLYDEMMNRIEEARQDNLNCYNVITNKDNDNPCNIFKVYVYYQAELSPKNRNDKQKRLLANAVNILIRKCIDGSEQDYKTYFTNEINSIDNIVKENKRSVSLEDSFIKGLKRYLEYYVTNMWK